MTDVIGPRNRRLSKSSDLIRIGAPRPRVKVLDLRLSFNRAGLSLAVEVRAVEPYRLSTRSTARLSEASLRAAMIYL
jgi:hypothetical protein